MELNANRNLLKTFNEFGRHHLPMHFQLLKNKKLELLVPYGLKKWLVTNSSCKLSHKYVTVFVCQKIHLTVIDGKKVSTVSTMPKFSIYSNFTK